MKHDPPNGAWIRTAVDAFEGPLVRYATRLTGSVEQARDVAQDTFLQLCRADRGEVEPRLAQWLFTVCRNRALELGRKDGRMKTALDGCCETASVAEHPAAGIEAEETTSEVLRHVNSLPANQQEVVRLKFQNAMSYREIAAITGLSASNVGYLLHTAIQTLRQKLNVE